MAIVFKDLIAVNEDYSSFLKEFASDVKAGLTNIPKTLPQKYLYDNRGSEIFRRIMDVEEYYPTKCELELVNNNKQDILALMGERFNLVDLGAGDGVKTMVLLEACMKKKEVMYVPIDISKGSNEELAKQLKRKVPGVNATIVTGTYQGGLTYLNETFKQQSLVCMFGPSIGNYTRQGAADLLKQLHKVMKPNDLLLITFDLRKDYKVIEAAYDDHLGVSRDFDMNVLFRINQELKGNFNLDKFFFHSYFDAVEGCIKNFLISKEEQQATIDITGEKFHFDPFEPILVEESHKYTLKEIDSLANRCGYEITHSFHDSRKYAIASIWKKLQ